MANSTIYPYGTSGSLPSSIGLVNDLTTGGVGKALTAEMGKYIGTMIGYLEIGSCVEEGFYLVDNDLNIGAKIDSGGLLAVNIITGKDV